MVGLRRRCAPEAGPMPTTIRSRLFSIWRTKRTIVVERLLKTSLAAILALCIGYHPCPAHAGMQSGIDHLLQAIETSGCSFTRNGNVHDGQAAGEHIRRKFAHTKRRIKSAEDFIRYAATQSSLSGRPYQVTCDGIEMPTAEWLTEELARFREKTR